MTPDELIEEIEAVGGRLALNGDKISYVFPDGAVVGDLIERLREMKPDVIEILRRRAGLPWPGYHGGQPFVCRCGVVFDTSAGYAQHQVYDCKAESGGPGWALPTSASGHRDDG
jgi:hypothetical protein